MIIYKKSKGEIKMSYQIADKKRNADYAKKVESWMQQRDEAMTDNINEFLTRNNLKNLIIN